MARKPLAGGSTEARCRFDGQTLHKCVLDLGTHPLANGLIASDSQATATKRYPLQLFFNERNGLLQTGYDILPEAIFTREYPFYSSTSAVYREHTRTLVRYCVARYRLTKDSNVLEIGSNDGYLLECLRDEGVGALGIEPSDALVEASLRRGVRARCDFFSRDVAAELLRSSGAVDLIVGCNVLAHMPDLRGTLLAVGALLSHCGTAIFEVPYAMKLGEGGNVTSVYHEHFFYFTLTAIYNVCTACELTVTDVEQIATHGGSLRVFIAKRSCGDESLAVRAMLQDEAARGAVDGTAFGALQQVADSLRDGILAFLQNANVRGERVVGYPASAKGVTLMNFCEANPSLLLAVGDKATSKIGKRMPGCGILVVSPDALKELRPDYVVIFSQNIVDEVRKELNANQPGSATLVELASFLPSSNGEEECIS